PPDGPDHAVRAARLLLRRVAVGPRLGPRPGDRRPVPADQDGLPGGGTRRPGPALVRPGILLPVPGDDRGGIQRRRHRRGRGARRRRAGVPAVSTVVAPNRFVAGLDLGRQADPSALSLLQWYRPPPLRTAYGEVVQPEAPRPPVYELPTLVRW